MVTVSLGSGPARRSAIAIAQRAQLTSAFAAALEKLTTGRACSNPDQLTYGFSVPRLPGRVAVTLPRDWGAE
jgi:hypothetical protein